MKNFDNTLDRILGSPIDKAIQEYKNISGLSEIQLINWIKINPFVYEWIEKRAEELSR
tara:strand:+ start:41 stop:214 length:174 start_codon:yes stop_codon:yes gene_type:complete